MEDLSPTQGLQDASLLELKDEFTGGGITSGTIGDLGWTETSSAAGTNSLQPGGVGKGSVFRLTTGAVSGNNKRLHAGQVANDPIVVPTNVTTWRWIVRIPTITTLIVRVGLMQDVSATAGGTAGVFAEFDPTGATTWRGFTRQASTSSAPQVMGSAVVAGNWYVVEVRRRPGTPAWEMWLNNALAGAIATAQPSTNLNFGILVQTATAAARSVDIDYTYLRSSLGQRFT